MVVTALIGHWRSTGHLRQNGYKKIGLKQYEYGNYYKMRCNDYIFYKLYIISYAILSAILYIICTSANPKEAMNRPIWAGIVDGAKLF